MFSIPFVPDIFTLFSPTFDSIKIRSIWESIKLYILDLFACRCIVYRSTCINLIFLLYNDSNSSRSTSIRSHTLHYVKFVSTHSRWNQIGTPPLYQSFPLHFPIGELELANLPRITKCRFTRNVGVIEFRIRTNENSLRSCKRWINISSSRCEKLTRFKISSTHCTLSPSFPTFISKLDRVHKFPSHRDTIECFEVAKTPRSFIVALFPSFLGVYTERGRKRWFRVRDGKMGSRRVR